MKKMILGVAVLAACGVNAGVADAGKNLYDVTYRTMPAGMVLIRYDICRSHKREPIRG